jgi:hypothetical protein
MYAKVLISFFITLMLAVVASWAIPSNVKTSNAIDVEEWHLSGKYLAVLKNHSCYKAFYNSETIRFCYPKVVISGVPKCGTSALFELFDSHPNFEGGTIKENCPNDTNDVTKMWEYFKTLQTQTDSALASGKDVAVLVSGCINIDSDIAFRRQLQNPSTVYILLFRDITNFFWATYNFWCSPKYDGSQHCRAGGWTNPMYHHRSPEMFHKIITALSQGKHISHPFNLAEPFSNSSVGYFKDYATKFWSEGIIQSDQLIYVANEALAHNSTHTWARIMQNAGFTIPELVHHPHSEYFNSIRVNTGSSKSALFIVFQAREYC